MKKLLLSGFVVLIFIAYIYHQRHENSASLQNVQQSIVNKSAATSKTATQSNNQSASSAQVSTGTYKNGTYTGDVTDAYYGNVQVQAVISGGKITDVKFLQYPSDNRTSQSINGQATPMLTQEAISVQSAKVDVITGATLTSSAFVQSLTTALAHAS